MLLPSYYYYYYYWLLSFFLLIQNYFLRIDSLEAFKTKWDSLGADSRQCSLAVSKCFFLMEEIMTLTQEQVCDLIMGFSASVLFRRSSSKQHQLDGSSDDDENSDEPIESKENSSRQSQRRKPFVLNTLHTVYSYLQTIKRLYEGYSLNRFSFLRLSLLLSLSSQKFIYNIFILVSQFLIIFFVHYSRIFLFT